MTEEEAKTKWCPSVQIVSYVEDGKNYAISNRKDKDSRNTNCIASDCMMWIVSEKPSSWVDDYEPSPSELGGHCGLAK